MKLQNEVQTLRNQPVHIVTFACKIPFRIKKDTNKDYADNVERNISTHQSSGQHPTWWRSWSLLSRTIRNIMKQSEIKATRGYYWTTMVTQEWNGLRYYSIIGLRTFGNTYKEPRAHEQEPPPTGVVQFQVEATNKFTNLDIVMYRSNNMLRSL